MSDRLMSTGDVAEVLGVSEATVKRWADASVLTCIRTPGGHRKFRLRDIAMHLASRRAPGEAAAEPSDQERQVEDLVSGLLVGDTEKVVGAIASARLQRASFAAIADTLLYPAVLRVGQACTVGRCETFHQHIAFNTLIDVCARQKQALRGSGPVRGRMIAAPMPGEPNDLLARLSTLVGVESGLDAYLLGTGLSPTSVSRAAEDLGASWVVLSGGTTELAPGLVQYVEAVLSGTERSQARVVCVCADPTRLEGLPEDVLSVRDLRETESLLAPVALRMVR
jgi:excisionase family DNA binding protein